MIDIKNLHVSYGPKKIIENLDLNIKKGTITSVLGNNGSGKTTMVKALAKKVHYTGDVKIDGKNLGDYSQKALAKKVAFLHQNNTPLEGFTVREVVLYGREPYREMFKSYNNTDFECVQWALEKTGLTDFADCYSSRLSGGQLQRVFLAMALAQKPDVLVLDEPTNHLDIKYQYGIMELIKKLNQELHTTILIVIHDINLASIFSDEVIMFKSGKIFQHGSPKDCITEENIYHTFDLNVSITDAQRPNIFFNQYKAG